VCSSDLALGPMLDQIASEHPEVRVVKVNIDAEPALAERYGVLSVPTVIRFDGGEPSQTFTGLRPKPVLKRALGL
jgi:thioredoxin 1